jgi:hypothetical protein
MLGVEFSSDRIENMSGVRGNGRVGISSNVLDKLDACIVTFESTTELCIAEELGEAMYG